MAEHNSYLELRNALEDAIKNGGASGDVTSDDIFDGLIELIENAGLMKEKVTIAKEDIYTVNTVAVTIMEAPGEDTINIPVLIVAEKVAGSAYSNANDISVRFEHGTDNLLTMKASGFLDQTSQYIIFSSNFNSIAGIANDALVLYSGKDPDATEGSAVTFWIYYRQVAL